MTTFWIIALGLGALAAAFVIVPVMVPRLRPHTVESPDDRTGFNVSIYRERAEELERNLDNGEIDSDEFDALKLEAEKTLLRDTESSPTGAQGSVTRRSLVLPAILAILVPVFALVAYSDFGFSWGAIGDVELTERLRTGDPNDAEGVRANIAELAARLEQQPDNDEGWYLLAQSYMNHERYEDAAGAFDHLIERYPTDADLLTYRAQSLFLAEDRRVTPRVDEAIEATFAVDPNNITMLEIRGIEALGAERFEDALAYFQKAAGLAEGNRAELISEAIATVRTMMRSRGQEVAGAKPMRAIDVEINVSEGVDVAGDTSVYVFARAVDGPPMPLAVLKLQRADLPQTVRLTEAMAMTSDMSLADFDRVEVIARISLSGDATASAGDPEGRSGPIDMTGEVAPASLTIREPSS